MTTVHRLLAEAMALSKDERRDLSERLECTFTEAPELSPAWRDVIERRWQGHLDDERELLDGDDVLAELSAGQ